MLNLCLTASEIYFFIAFLYSLDKNQDNHYLGKDISATDESLLQSMKSHNQSQNIQQIGRKNVEQDAKYIVDHVFNAPTGKCNHYFIKKHMCCTFDFVLYFSCIYILFLHFKIGISEQERDNMKDMLRKYNLLTHNLLLNIMNYDFCKMY